MNSRGVAAVRQQQGGGGAVGGRVDLVVQPLAQRPVADPVVVLDEEDEPARGEAGRVGARGGSPGRSSTRRVKSQPRLIVRTRSATVPRKSRKAPSQSPTR